MAVKVNEQKCKGCQYCIMFCPRKAIALSGSMNNQGVEYVQVDSEKCIECGICYTVCPDIVFEISE